MTESEERLKRIEILLETCAKVTVNNQSDIKEFKEQVKQTAEQIQRNSEQIQRNSEQIQRNSENLATLTDMFSDSVRIMQTMQTEIKGLQTENKRILDQLFGNSQN